MVVKDSRMYKTLKALYPEEFQERRPKPKKAPRKGFVRRRVSRRLDSIKMFLSGYGRAKLTMGSFAIVLAIAGVYVGYVYNNFTTYTNDILTSKANIEKEIQRRNDLINNLIPPTLNYSLYEKEMFSHVAEIRKEFTNFSKLLQKNPNLKGMLKVGIKAQMPSIFGIFENYPVLQANKPFADLMQELIETENRIATTRTTFNETVNVFNTYLDKVPAAWIGLALGYRKQTWFGAEEGAAALPDLERLAPVAGHE